MCAAVINDLRESQSSLFRLSLHHIRPADPASRASTVIALMQLCLGGGVAAAAVEHHPECCIQAAGRWRVASPHL